MRPVYKRIINVAAVVMLLAACVLLVFHKPAREQLESRISSELITEAGKNFSGVYYDFGIFNITRGRNVKTAVTETFIGGAGGIISVNEGFGHYLADVVLWLPALAGGAQVTVSLTICAVLAGLFLSVFLALGKISKNPVISGLCGAYIFFFRGSPLLMQLFFIYYGLPVINPALTINNKFFAAFVAFTLNTGAYCAEIIRAAIQSIDKGQFEASRVLGLTYGQTMRIIIIPQSIRRLLPPVANEFIMILKDASLVSIIALADLTHVTRSISSSASNVMVYIPAMIIYLIITAFFSAIFTNLEKRFSIYQ
ncbi:MAG: amino acid ABC transporter permease [Clostridiales bacterium]|jgi:polar amino acid transport system permease protein|nr:amino acid ABC transporter permease [Clostridiales bacterium]